VQSAEHAARFRALGVPAERLHVTGNMKYDLMDASAASRDARRTLRERLGYAPEDVVVIGGSLHPGEHQALRAACAALPERRGAALVVVPRYPADAARVEEYFAAQGRGTVRKTALDRGEAEPPGRGQVLIVDTVGELGALYSAADIAFVGGSLFFRGSNKGGHNLMEPAIRGLAVLFGPYNFSFKETVEDLLQANAAVQVADAQALAAEIAALVADPPRRLLLGERAKQVVLNGRGASERNYALLGSWLLPCAERLQAPALKRTMPRASGHLDI
ncbi:MAG TPA: hypothetical protein VFY39_15830, partial [Gammaproteobacteria bacterium]|nr:hypothetical protein [Gammaproteobacteria bacterium]